MTGLRSGASTATTAARSALERWAANIATMPPIEWPTRIGLASEGWARATDSTSVAQVVKRYASRRSLSPWPDRSRATTWWVSANSGAVKLHHHAWAAPPWTKTSGRLPGRPQESQEMPRPATSVRPLTGSRVSASATGRGRSGMLAPSTVRPNRRVRPSWTVRSDVTISTGRTALGAGPRLRRVAGARGRRIPTVRGGSGACEGRPGSGRPSRWTVSAAVVPPSVSRRPDADGAGTGRWFRRGVHGATAEGSATAGGRRASGTGPRRPRSRSGSCCRRTAAG